MVIVQIESKEAVARLDEMASVPGVDVICIGPQDLSISLNVHGEFTNPIFLEAVAKIVEVSSRYNIPVGMVSRDANSFKLWHEMGIRFLVCGSDGSLLSQAAKQDIAILREITGE